MNEDGAVFLNAVSTVTRPMYKEGKQLLQQRLG